MREYSLIIHEQLEFEIREQALTYQEEFSTGINDFLDAIEDTYNRILTFPFSHPKVLELEDTTVRCISVRANQNRKNYAKKFPFKLIFKVYQDQSEIVVFQLWSEKSNQRIKNL